MSDNIVEAVAEVGSECYRRCAKLEATLSELLEALYSITTSHPTTEEGEALANIARTAIAKVTK